MIRIRTVEVLGGFRVRLLLTDGRHKTIDLEPLLDGPAFARLLDDPAEFRRVRVSPEFGCLEWPNGADICPDLLIEDLRPA